MRFKAVLLLTLAISTLSGCVTTEQGNFNSAPVSLAQTLAKDSANQLAMLYPPARTRFELNQPNQDPFGRALEGSLRQKGYSLGQTQSVSRSIKSSALGMPLNYLVDEPIKQSLFRVTLLLGSQSISRAYKLKNGILTPAGFWVRKE